MDFNQLTETILDLNSTKFRNNFREQQIRIITKFKSSLRNWIKLNHRGLPLNLC